MTVRKSEFEKLLGRVVSQGVARADSGLLREVAEKLWYGRCVPNLSKFPEPERREAGYLVDRLARVNVMAVARKQKVLAALTPYKPAAPDSQGPAQRRIGRHLGCSRGFDASYGRTSSVPDANL